MVDVTFLCRTCEPDCLDGIDLGDLLPAPTEVELGDEAAYPAVVERERTVLKSRFQARKEENKRQLPLLSISTKAKSVRSEKRQLKSTGMVQKQIKTVDRLARTIQSVQQSEFHITINCKSLLPS